MLWEEEALGDYPDPAMIGLSGLERLQAARQGRTPVPPIAYLVEMPFTELSEGHAGFEMPASPWFANAAAVIPGGMLAVLADAPLGASLGTTQAPGETFTTAEISLTFLRPLRSDPEAKIAGNGQVIHRSRTVGLTEAFMLNTRTEELVAFGTSRLSIFPPPDPLPEPPKELPVIDQVFPGDAEDHPLRRPLEGETLDPALYADRSGLELTEAWIAGELPWPPIYYLVGHRPVEAAVGEVTWTMPCSKWLATAARTVQGGFTALLAEAALASAVFTTADAGVAVAPLDFKVNFLRPVFPDGRDLTAKAKVVHRGRRLAVSNAEVINADGKRVALATGSAMYLPGRPADLSGVELVAGEEAEPV